MHREYAGLQGVSIHPPRGGRDALCAANVCRMVRFNPPSPWGEGPSPRLIFHWTSSGFNPPSPWGEGRHDLRGLQLPHPVSIHPPRGGRDVSSAWLITLFHWFQSTLPVGGGTPDPGGRGKVFPGFNPPSPWGEGLPYRLCLSGVFGFNPPSPWGEGHIMVWMPLRLMLFQSTLPVGGGTSER